MNIFLVNAGESEILLKSIKNCFEIKNCYVLDNLTYNKKIKKYFIVNDYLDFIENSRLNSREYSSYYNKLDRESYDFYKKYIFSALDILDRYDYNHSSFSSEQKIIHFFQTINFFEEYINKKNIDLVFFQHTPHHINTYSLYLVCEKNKIQTLINTQFSYGNEIRFTIDENIKKRCHLIKKNIVYFPSDKEDLNLIRNHFDFLKPKYMKPRSGKILKYLGLYYESFIFLVLKELITILKSGLFKRSDYYLKINRHKYLFEEKNLSNLRAFLLRSIIQRYEVFKLKRFYKKISINFNYLNNEKYCVFFPNYQPEATTSPSCDIYSNILICLETIKGSIPKDWKIIYKEHPSTFNYQLESFFKKKKSFYESIKKRIENISFLNFDENNNELIRKSSSVFVQSSNIAIQALLQKKPTIVFGNSWFDEFNGIHKYKDVASLKKYLSSQEFLNKNVENLIFSYYKSIKNYSYSNNNIENFSDCTNKLSNIIKQYLNDKK